MAAARHRPSAKELLRASPGGHARSRQRAVDPAECAPTPAGGEGADGHDAEGATVVRFGLGLSRGSRPRCPLPVQQCKGSLSAATFFNLETGARFRQAMTGDYFAFIRELPKSFHQIGAMLPSSRSLGRAMVRPLRKDRRHDAPLRILEVGPGTGPFTRQILKLMRPEDRLTICEINERFLERLKRRLANDEHYLRHADRVEFFLGPVQALPRERPEQRFDIVVSSLPFSNFMPADVDEIMSIFHQLTDGRGKLTVLEYLGVRRISTVFAASPEARERYIGVERVIERWRRRVAHGGHVSSRVSLLNVPPALAIEFDFAA